MGTIGKGILLLNTVRYLKPQQLFNQIRVRFRKKELFWDYRKHDTPGYKSVSLWISGLDDDPDFIARFAPDTLVKKNKLMLLNEIRDFDKWSFPEASHLWNFNVHYLEYLVPLYSLWQTSRDDEYKEKINRILEDWYKRGSLEADSNQAYTISLRVVNQLIIADAADDKQRLYDSIYAQYRFLLKHQEKHLLGNHYLENLKAIVICSVVFSEWDVYDEYIGKLLTEIKEEITPDGLHFELSPMYHKIVLEDIIRVTEVLKQAEKSEHKQIVGYIAKMTDALYSLENGTCRTPLFNDSGNNIAKPTNSLINTCRELLGAEPQNGECVSGYHKLYDEKITVIADAGPLSPSYMPGHAHNDCLSFELFYDGMPVFVNSGTYAYQGERRQYFRSTAAHNTVMINGHEQSELWGEHRAGRRIKNVKCIREENSIVCSYNNYLGEKHSRKMKLFNHRFEVMDATSGAGRSYLHLTPGLRYKDNKIIGKEGLEILLESVNADIEVQKSFYSENFGVIEENECLVFSWNDNSEKHGYRIKIEEN